MDEGEIQSWLNSDANDPGFQLMTDYKICDHVASEALNQEEVSEPEESEQIVCPVTNSMAAHMLDKCLTWLEHQPEANQHNTGILTELRALAVIKRRQLLKQLTLTDMLPKCN